MNKLQGIKKFNKKVKEVKEIKNWNLKIKKNIQPTKKSSNSTKI